MLMTTVNIKEFRIDIMSRWYGNFDVKQFPLKILSYWT